MLASGGSARASLAPAPTTWWQTNGRVDAIVSSGGLTYIAGNFTTVTTPANVTSPAGGVAAFGAAGNLVWAAPALNSGGVVRALTVSAGAVYAGGSFSTVGGAWHRNLVAYDAASGALLGFNPSPNFAVDALASSGSTVFLGGEFTRTSGTLRSALAAYAHPDSTHWALAAWNPGASGTVSALLTVPRGLLVGGTFRTIAGASRTNLALLGLTSATVQPWLAQSPFANVLSLTRIDNLVVAGLGGRGGSVGGYLQTTGQQLWTSWFDGNVTAVTVADGQAVVGGHFRNYCPDGIASSATYPFYQCANGDSVERDHVAAIDLATGHVLDPNWAPILNSVRGVYAALGTNQSVELGGDFTQTGVGAGATATAYLARFGLPADTTPPTMTQAPSGSITSWAKLSPTLIPLRVAYAAADNASGVCSFAVGQAPATPPAPALNWPNAPWATAWLAPATTATFSATPADCAGNTGSSLTGAPVTVRSYVRSGITFIGRWKFPLDPEAFRGVHAVTTWVGSSARMTFTGREVAFVADRGSANMVSVSIDGHAVQTINEFTRVSDPRRVVFVYSWPTAGMHRIGVTLLRSGTHPRGTLDRFIVVS